MSKLLWQETESRGELRRPYPLEAMRDIKACIQGIEARLYCVVTKDLWLDIDLDSGEQRRS